MINDILDFSKVEAGKLTIEPIPFDLCVAVEDVADQMAPLADEKGIEIVLDYQPEPGRYVVGDPGRVRQVLTNLVSNAVKFTNEGHVLVTVEAQASQESQTIYRIAVEDTGIGTDAKRIDSLFEPFTQADASTTRVFGGTGLGLSICKQLVELMGGEIGATSQPGEGSCFWFILPLPFDASAPEPPADRPSLRGVRVLIVDDLEVNRRVLHLQVGRWGMRDVRVGSGQAALDCLREAAAGGDPFGIALIDQQMPVMDGHGLTQAIKADPLIRDTVIVMVTSIGLRGEAQEMFDAGLAGYAVKPVHATDLMDILATAWNGRDTARGLITRHTVAESRAASEAPPAAAAPLSAASIPARVLVAEDNSVNQKVAILILKKLGCSVDLAADGEEAVSMSAESPYDVIFMDCQMPQMDGYEATAAIRSREEGHTPIVAMTANAMEGDRERCLQAGMDDYVAKPISAGTIRGALERWVVTRDGGPRAAPSSS